MGNTIDHTAIMNSSTPDVAELAARFVDNLHDALVVVDPAGNIVYVNAKATEMFGYSADELQGRTIEMLVPEQHRDRHVEIRSPLRGDLARRPYVSGLNLQARHRNGDVFDVEIALTAIDVDGQRFVCSAVRDLTYEGSANAYFRNLLESAPDAMIIVDDEGTIEIVNQQCQIMFGYSRDELVGQCVDFLLPERLRGHHADYRRNYFRDPHLRPMGRGMELAGLRKDGTEFPVEISLSPVNGPEGVRVSSVIRDVTVQKKLESELIEARREAERANRANTAFLAAASHDLRQPVQALSLLNGALRRTVDNPLAKEMVESQQQSLDAMTNLLNSLLDISRLDAGAIEPEIEDFPMRRLIDRLSSEFGRQAGQKGISLSVGECEETVRSDPNLLAEIIQNLVSNAIRYTGEGGNVSVSCAKAGDRVRVDVRDTGIGIEPDQLDEIFREFHQVKKKGSNVEGFGLGLAIVRRLADLLDVRILVDSTVGQGSCFSALVPIASEDSADEDIPDEAMSPTMDDGSRILLVEDDAGVANAWALLLTAEGFVVERAESVAEVEALLQTMKEPPKLIISDYHLADGSTGIEAVRSVRTAFAAELPVFIVSGDTSQLIEQARTLPNSMLMRKPVNTDYLLKLAHRAVEDGVIEED
jgi:PAS domain S-box-containing protein